MRLLLVDDDVVNRLILRESLEGEGYDLVEAGDGEEAWKYLETEGDSFSVVLLDQMMPKLDGLSVLNRMMAHDNLKHIPVIFQTAAVGPLDVQAGVEAGAFFYLSKPFELDLLKAIVASAVRKSVKQCEAQKDLLRQAWSLESLESATFRVQTLDEVHSLGILLAKTSPDPDKIVMGLIDLMINAVEHGNLGIDYEEKTRLQESEEWEAEVGRRMKLPGNIRKYVTVTFQRLVGEIHIVITDEGQGFDWTQYEEFSPEMALASHGRGIAMAKALCFDRLEYRGSGNTVCCIVYTPAREIEEDHCVANHVMMNSTSQNLTP
ncbi:MAG: response regulator [Nitrospirales bacterium]